jgi:hypothetical protein
MKKGEKLQMKLQMKNSRYNSISYQSNAPVWALLVSSFFGGDFLFFAQKYFPGKLMSEICDLSKN